VQGTPGIAQGLGAMGCSASPGAGVTLNLPGQGLAPIPCRLGLLQGSGSVPPASPSLLSALIHLANSTWKQLHAEGGAGKEPSLTIN